MFNAISASILREAEGLGIINALITLPGLLAVMEVSPEILNSFVLMLKLPPICKLVSKKLREPPVTSRTLIVLVVGEDGLNVNSPLDPPLYVKKPRNTWPVNITSSPVTDSTFRSNW